MCRYNTKDGVENVIFVEGYVLNRKHFYIQKLDISCQKQII